MSRTPTAAGPVYATFHDQRLTFGDSALRVQIDATKDPRWIDLYNDATPVFPGIYNLVGDTLIIRVVTTFEAGKATRPTNFDATGPGETWHFERVRK
jgi:uncharacterized protein (TIGR03067 family)